MNNLKLNNIAFQGQPGAYSEMACVEAFPEMQTVPCENFEDAFEAVLNGTTKSVSYTHLTLPTILLV